jgi:hypothetical protein
VQNALDALVSSAFDHFHASGFFLDCLTWHCGLVFLFSYAIAAAFGTHSLDVGVQNSAKLVPAA